MYIAMQCSDSNGTLNTEVCTFCGIRYDTRYKSAVISTEHLNHDYVIPMEARDYENAVRQIMDALKNHADIIRIEEGIVCRGRKGESRHVEPQKLVIAQI